MKVSNFEAKSQKPEVKASFRKKSIKAACLQFLLALVFTSAIASALYSAPVIREEIDDYKAHLDETKKKLDSIKEQIKAQRETIKKEVYKEKTTSRYIQKLDREMDMTRKELEVFSNNISVLQNGVNELQKRIDSAEKEKKERERMVMQILRRQYEQKDSAYLKFLIKSGNLSDFIKRYKFIKILSRKNAEAVDRYRALIEKLEADKDSIAAYKDELDGVKKSKEGEWKRFKDEKWQKRVLLKNIKDNIKQRSKMVQELESSARKLTKFIDNIEATVELSDKDAERAFVENKGRFPWPVDAGSILAKFGKYKHPKFQTIVDNHGIHISEHYGAAVYSIFGGVVKYADWFEGYGKMVIIYHGGGYFTVYGHLSAFNVSNGQKVRIKQTIGLVGDTESFYGNEVYFELRKKGVPVDPLRYLKRR